MWITTTVILALAASTNAMINYGDMIAHETITQGPVPTDASNIELKKRVAQANLEGYTSKFGAWTAVYCPSGSTFKTFSTSTTTDVWAACCPISGDCDFNVYCFADRADKWSGDTEQCTDTCDTGYIYRSMHDATPIIMPGCWEPFTLYRVVDGPIAGSPATTTDGSSPSSVTESGSSASSTTASSVPSKSSGIHSTTITIIAVVAGIVFLAIVTGLVAYICILRRRNNKDASIDSPQNATATELNKLQPTPPTAPVTPLAPQPWNGKVELPTDFAGYNAYEMAASPAPGHAKMYEAPGQQPGVAYFAQPPHPGQGGWSPHTPAEPYPYSPQHIQPGVSPVSTHAVPLELPARRSGRWGTYQELPG